MSFDRISGIMITIFFCLFFLSSFASSSSFSDLSDSMSGSGSGSGSDSMSGSGNDSSPFDNYNYYRFLYPCNELIFNYTFLPLVSGFEDCIQTAFSGQAHECNSMDSFFSFSSSSRRFPLYHFAFRPFFLFSSLSKPFFFLRSQHLSRCHLRLLHLWKSFPRFSDLLRHSHQQ
jgi:hypothetical protein